MKRIITLVFLCVPWLLSAQEMEKKISVNVYVGSFAGTSINEEVNVLFFFGKHAIGIGPYFTKTGNRNFNPGGHLSYQFYLNGDSRKFNSFLSADYIYYNDQYDYAEGESHLVLQISHQVTVGYGFNYK